MIDDIQDWMIANNVKRVVRIGNDGWCVYLIGIEPLGTGASLAEALADAEKWV